MEPSQLPSSLPPNISLSLPGLTDYLVQHWEEVTVVATRHLLLLIVIIALTALVTWLVFHFFHKRGLALLESQKQLLEARNTAKDEDIKRRDEGITHLKEKITQLKTSRESGHATSEAQQPTKTPSLPNIFEIEHLEHQQLWKEGNERELVQVFAGLPPPRNATRVLQVRLRITATPAKVVEDLQLDIANNRIHLSAGDWQPRAIAHCESTLNFDIPSHIELTSHTIQLIAKCKEGIEKKSAVFRVLPLQSSVR